MCLLQAKTVAQGSQGFESIGFTLESVSSVIDGLTLLYIREVHGNPGFRPQQSEVFEIFDNTNSFCVNMSLIISLGHKMADWETFFSQRNNAFSSNPFWDDINNDHAFTDSTTDNLENLVEHLNKRKLTNYLNYQWDGTGRWQDVFKDLPKAIQETSFGLDALESFKKIDTKEYFDILADFEWAPTLGNIRLYIYCRFIVKNFPQLCQKPINLLEIGGGSGTLALFLRSYLDVANYTDVDFPEMCLINYYQHLTSLKTESPEFFFVNSRLEKEPAQKTADKKGVYYMEPAAFFHDKSDLGAFDLIVNTHSLQEMDQTIRDQYIHKCCEHLSIDGIFFNVNWEQKKMSNRDGSFYYNSPLTYPYPESVEIIEKMECPVGRVMRLKHDYKKSTLGFLTVVRKKIRTGS